MTCLRLSLFLARAGVASRRAAEQLIAQGRVSVNGEPVRAQGVKIDPASDRVEVNGRRLESAPQAKRYFLFHKPLGVVTTLKDKHAEKCVADYFRDIPEKLVPAGRLDKNSTGLLLLTNDGDLIHRLTHPRYGVEKRYRVKIKPALSPAALDGIQKGVMLEGKKTAACIIGIVSQTGKGMELFMILREGRKREIREMMKSAGASVISLHCESYGPLTLGALRTGARRELSPKEIEQLKDGAQAPYAPVLLRRDQGKSRTEIA